MSHASTRTTARDSSEAASVSAPQSTTQATADPVAHGESPPTLLLVPTLPAVRTSEGTIVLTEKFVEGTEAFADCWPGHLEVLFRPVEERTDNLDNRAYAPDELPFSAIIADYHSDEARYRLSRATVALGGLCHEQTHLAALASELGVPFVYTSEYTLRTRCQIARVEEQNPLRRYRRMLFEVNLERRQRRSLMRATGVQCNGTPTYDRYHEHVPHPLLFFDTRLGEKHLVPHEVIDRRVAELAAGRRPRLAFSGRLKEMKGADHLVPFADELRKLGQDFVLEIFGEGVLMEKIEREIERRGLQEHVLLRGTLRFADELLPRLQNDVDLFVACHRQGDPSCTYLETFGCGLPILGYANEAFSGLLERAVAGVKTPMDDPKALAVMAKDLLGDPDRLARLARAARRFAEANTCEKTFQRRTDHLLEVAHEHPARRNPARA